MNDNINPTPLSNKLEEVFEQMDEINSACQKIENFIQVESAQLEDLLNPEKDADIAKEIRFYMANCLKNLTQKFET